MKYVLLNSVPGTALTLNKYTLLLLVNNHNTTKIVCRHWYYITRNILPTLLTKDHDEEHITTLCFRNLAPDNGSSVTSDARRGISGLGCAWSWTVLLGAASEEMFLSLVPASQGDTDKLATAV